MKQLTLILFGILALSFSGSGQGKARYYLAAQMDGLHLLDDNTTTNIWGFGLVSGPPQQTQITLPAPTIRATFGDSLEVKLFNASQEDHTIHWHGLDVDQLNDGVPSTSFPIYSNQEFTYEFAAPHEGVYLYHCHVLTTLHLTMGMYGMVIIEADDPNEVYNGGPRFSESVEILSSDMDRTWNDNPTAPGPFNLFQSNYFMLNGLSGSQLADSSFALVEDTLPALLRLGNISYGAVTYRFPDGLQAEAIMSDGRVLPSSITQDSLKLYPGERYSVLLSANVGGVYEVEVDRHDPISDEILQTQVWEIEYDLINNINEKSAATFKLFPNPSSGSFSVESHVSGELEVRDITGGIVYQSQVRPGEHRVNLANMQSGIYIVRLGNFVRKLIVH